VRCLGPRALLRQRPDNRTRIAALPSNGSRGEFAKAVSILGAGGKINYEGASGSCDFDKDGAAHAANLIWEVKGTERVTTVPLIDP
jgi:hypothetical protein